MELIKISTRRSVILICSPCLKARRKNCDLTYSMDRKSHMYYGKSLKSHSQRDAKYGRKYAPKIKHIITIIYIFLLFTTARQ